jgi:hypothetical protein
LLADPKLNYQRDDEAPKVLAEHGTYGQILPARRWASSWPKYPSASFSFRTSPINRRASVIVP